MKRNGLDWWMEWTGKWKLLKELHPSQLCLCVILMIPATSMLQLQTKCPVPPLEERVNAPDPFWDAFLRGVYCNRWAGGQASDPTQVANHPKSPLLVRQCQPCTSCSSSMRPKYVLHMRVLMVSEVLFWTFLFSSQASRPHHDELVRMPFRQKCQQCLQLQS